MDHTPTNAPPIDVPIEIETEYDRGFKDAVESMMLAGAAEAVIQTVLDAYQNNAC